MFSDSYKWLKISLPMAAMVAMCIYSGIAGPKLLPDFVDYLKEPARFDGQHLMVQFTQVKTYLGADRFVVQDIRGHRIEVEGRIPPGQEGCFISFEAEFKSPGYLILKDRWHIYARDTEKLVVSAVGLIGVAAFFLRRFRFNLRRLRFEDRF